MELLLVKPKVKSISYDEVNQVEVFEISPLEAGQGICAFGNSLRSTLLSNIPGYAVTNFQIGFKASGMNDFEMKSHIFDTIPGATPDLTDLSLSLKDSRFRLVDIKTKDITIQKKGPCTITLGDFATDGVVVINPDLELLKIVNDTEITMSIRIQEGRGYRDENCFDTNDWISIDASFSPVVRVLPQVSDVRVNGVSGYEKLTLTVETDGRLTPKQSLDVAIRILKEGYSVLMEGVEDVIENEAIYFDVQEEEHKPVTYKNLSELGLSVRAYNALKAFGINNTGDFERYTKKQIKNIDNFGKKSFEEVEKKLIELEIELKPN